MSWMSSFCYSEEEFAHEPGLTDQTKHRDGETRATFMRSVTQAPGAAGKQIHRWKRGPSSIFHVHVAFILACRHKWQTIKTAQRRGGNSVAAQMTPAVPDRVSCAPFNKILRKTFQEGRREKGKVFLLESKRHFQQIKKWLGKLNAHVLFS